MAPHQTPASAGHVQSQAARQRSPDVNINIYDDVSTSQVPNVQLTVNTNHYHDDVSNDFGDDVGDDVSDDFSDDFFANFNDDETDDFSDDELFDPNDDVWELPSKGFVLQKTLFFVNQFFL